MDWQPSFGEEGLTEVQIINLPKPRLNVVVVSAVWDNMPHCHPAAARLQDLFENDYGYEVTRIVLPSNQDAVAHDILLRACRDAAKRASQQGLLIIHYVGYGCQLPMKRSFMNSRNHLVERRIGPLSIHGSNDTGESTMIDYSLFLRQMRSLGKGIEIFHLMDCHLPGPKRFSSGYWIFWPKPSTRFHKHESPISMTAAVYSVLLNHATKELLPFGPLQLYGETIAHHAAMGENKMLHYVARPVYPARLPPLMQPIDKSPATMLSSDSDYEIIPLNPDDPPTDVTSPFIRRFASTVAIQNIDLSSLDCGLESARNLDSLSTTEYSNDNH